MKKLLLLLFLMTISLGYSQTFPLDFSDSDDLFTGYDGVAASIVSDGGNDVLQIVGATGSWDNSQLTLAQNINLADNNNNTITFRFKASAGSSGQHLLKFEGGVGGASVAEGFFNSTGTDWQTITINFGAGLGNYSKVVIFTDSGAASNGWNNSGTGTYLIDDLAGATNIVPVTIPAPTVAATTPTKDAADVISIFSNAYTDRVGTAFAPNWGQNPTYQQVNIVGNATNRYLNFSFVGNTFSAGGVNASSMQQLHLDIWTPDCTSFDVYILDGTAPEQKVTLTPTVDQWNSFDIDLSLYTSLTKSAILEFKFVKTDEGLKTIYLDNIYFWKAPAGTFTYYADTDADGYGAGAAVVLESPTAPDGYSVNNLDCAPTNAAINPLAVEIADGLDNNCNGVVDEGFPPSVGAPAPPARNAWDVVSIFSGAYDNLTINELPTSWSQLAIAPFSVESIGGNDTWKFGGEFLGMQINNTGVNLTQMTTMHIDYWTPDNKIMIAKLVNTIDGGEANTIVQDPVVTGTWRSVDIPMAQFGTSLNKSKITQILLDPQLGGSTVYVDNFYFYRPASAAPSPTITNFSVPAQMVGAANFAITPPTSNSAGAFTYTSSNTQVAKIVNGNMIRVVRGGTSIITATQAAAGSFGSGTITATFDVNFPGPGSPAPAPTVDAASVISIFSDSYSNRAGTNFYPNWGQSTQKTDVVLEGNNMLKYSKMNYQGIQLITEPTSLDVSAMTHLHLDIWTPNCTELYVSLVNQAIHEDDEKVIPTRSGWNRIDIPLYQFEGVALNNIGQLKLVATPSGSSEIYLDNLYFAVLTSKVKDSQCGFALEAINTAIFADDVKGAEKYRFEVTNGTNVRTFETTKSNFNLTKIAGTTFGTIYSIKVAVKINGVWGAYGTSCDVTTPTVSSSSSVPLTKMRVSQCESTLASIGSPIHSELVTSAEAYRFELTNGATVTEIESPIYYMFLTDTAIGTYGTTFSVKTKAKVNGFWGNYGVACSISTPALTANTVPTTQVRPSFCDATLTTLSTKIPASTVYNAEGYRFEITNGAAVIVYDSALYNFMLSDAGIVPTNGTTYGIRVAAKVNGVYGIYGTSCDVTMPSSTENSRQIVENTDFSLVAYPNPSNGAFKLQVNGSNNETISVLVFDMTGRQIENKVVKANEIENITLGQNYSTGIYNVIVSQGMNTKTVRLVKN